MTHMWDPDRQALKLLSISSVSWTNSLLDNVLGSANVKPNIRAAGWECVARNEHPAEV